MSTKNTQEMYEEHHAQARGAGFSVLKEERGKLFSAHIGTGKRVLDLGCRDGALTTFFTEGNNVLGTDIDTVALARARERLGIQTAVLDAHGDWNDLHKEQFDAVVAGEVLEHLFYPATVVSKVAAHLKPGGVFVGSVPNAFSLRHRLRYLAGTKKHTPLSDPTHVNHFGAGELAALLGRHFAHVQIVGLGRLGYLARLVPGWFAFDLVFVARK
jgi:2-polyprenyl-3-methyl-5-hydroxy-6-metoxy-1,4-benzoquinol methylase